MARSIDDHKASPEEEEKLVHELKDLIAKKGLQVDITDKAGVRRAASPALMGCARCTVCPCMICW